MFLDAYWAIWKLRHVSIPFVLFHTSGVRTGTVVLVSIVSSAQSLSSFISVSSSYGSGPLERIRRLNKPMLGTRWAAAGGVLVLNRRCTGRIIVLLPLVLLFRFKLPADAPSQSPGE